MDFETLLRRVLDWRGLDGDGITDPLRAEIMAALSQPAPVADDDGLIYGIHGGNVSPVAGVGETCPHCVTCGTLMIVSKEFVGVSVCPRCHGSGQAPGKGA